MIKLSIYANKGRLCVIKPLLLLMVLVSTATPALAQYGNGQVTADFNSGGIAQPLVAAASAQKQAQAHPDAYYVTGSGKTLRYKLHKDNYVLFPKEARLKKSNLKVATLRSSLEAEFATDLDLEEDSVFRGKIRAMFKAGTKHNAVLKKLRKKKDIDYISAVLINDKGQELSMSPGVVIRFHESGPVPGRLLSELSTLGLSLQRQLAFTDNEFLFEYSGLVEDPTGLFQASRAAMAIAEVEWAEPDFEAAPLKSFTPNDSLYPNQWHLNNTGQNGGQVGADINAAAGWELSRGTGTVVAVVDDGVELAHPDLPIWNNPGESGNGKETDGIDNDGNGYIDDFQGWDFGDDDNDPGPESGNDHGTSVSGVAAAQGDNSIGVSGSASNAAILPVRTGSMTCTAWGDSIRYAARHADVVNGSWGISGCETAIDSAIADAVAGTIPGSKRRDKGTPVLFATGNSASGWAKFTLTGFPAGTYNFEWLFTKNGSVAAGYDTMWLDDITWPGGSFEGFEGSLSDFTTGGDRRWRRANDGVHARGASGRSARAGAIGDSETSSLYATNKSVGAGNLTFWHWVSAEQGNDGLIFYVNGTAYMSWTPGQYGHVNDVGYPSSHPDAISIGASNDGGPSGSEERVYYSQFGPALDVLAPSSGGNQGITTTDRLGSDGYDTSDYTSGFGGTSSSTPLAAGVVADIIGIYPHITATQVRDALRYGADQIGPYAYVAGRNDHYGYGRVNLLGSLDWIKANNLAFDCDLEETLIADRWALIGLPCAADF